MEFLEPSAVVDDDAAVGDGGDVDDSWVRTMTDYPSTPGRIDHRKKTRSTLSVSSPSLKKKMMSSPSLFSKRSSTCPPTNNNSNPHLITSPPQKSKSKRDTVVAVASPPATTNLDPFGDDNHEFWVLQESRQDDLNLDNPFDVGNHMNHLSIDNETRQVMNRCMTPKSNRRRTQSCENYSPPTSSSFRKSSPFSRSNSSKSLMSKAFTISSPSMSSRGKKKKAALLENVGEINRALPSMEDEDYMKKPENIGLRLALPEARSIMTGHDVIPKSKPPSATQLVPVETSEASNTTESNEIVIRTSEKDPYPHQVTISSPSDLLFHAKLCHLLEQYCDSIINHQKPCEIFDLTTLVGRSYEELEQMHIYLLRRNGGGGMSSNPCNSTTTGIVGGRSLELSSTGSNGSSNGGGGGGVFSPTKHIVGDKSITSPVAKNKNSKPSIKRIPVPPHSSVAGNEPPPAFLANLLSCADDIVIEGRFHGSGDKTFDLGVEVTVFCSQKHRQFVVCYRGTPEQQSKPILIRSETQQKKIETQLLHPDYPNVQINASFRESYFFGNLEQNVFRLLHMLTQRDPFCDVIFTGHSFGGALATIGAVRYATIHSSMTVSCHVFGSPKIGATQEFKFLANSLPNLRIFRLEYGTDPYVKAPSSSDQHWTHVGHTITLQEEPLTNLSAASAASVQAIGGSSSTIKKQPSMTVAAAAASSPSSHKSGQSVMPTSSATTGTTTTVTVAAYRFDEGKIQTNKSSSSLFTSSLNSSAKLKKMKKDHELLSYVNALRPFSFGMKHWISGYVGQDGKGVTGHNNEERCVV